jgi:hypothetical protein
MDYKQLTAPCGRDCFNCPVYLSKDRPAIRSRIAKSYSIPVEQVHCAGCRDENGRIPFLGWTESCPILICTQEKSIDFCFECDEFPCDRLHPVADKADKFPHNTKMFNLCLIRKMGLEKWAEEKSKSVFKKYMSNKLFETVLGEKKQE